MRYVKVSLAFLYLLMLTACFFMGSGKESIVYRLTSQPLDFKMDSLLKGTLLVDNLSSRGFVKSRNMVFWNSKMPRETQQYNYHSWVEPPALLVRDILAQTLRMAGVSDHVITSNRRAKADYILSGTLLRMEQCLEPDNYYVLIEMELAIVQYRSREVLFVKRYSIRESVANNQIPAAVHGFELALANLISDFLRDLVQRFAEK